MGRWAYPLDRSLRTSWLMGGGDPNPLHEHRNERIIPQRTTTVNPGRVPAWREHPPLQMHARMRGFRALRNQRRLCIVFDGSRLPLSQSFQGGIMGWRSRRGPEQDPRYGATDEGGLMAEVRDHER
jgi:hypothetical protein